MRPLVVLFYPLFVEVFTACHNSCGGSDDGIRVVVDVLPGKQTALLVIAVAEDVFVSESLELRCSADC
jgi:hypothetical protein